MDIRYLADQLNLLLTVVGDECTEAWVAPLGADRILVFDNLWVPLLDPQLEKKRLRVAILVIHGGRQVDQVADFLLSTLVPIRAHHERLLRTLLRPFCQALRGLIPLLGRLLTLNETELLAGVSHGDIGRRALRILELVKKARLAMQSILGQSQFMVLLHLGLLS